MLLTLIALKRTVSKAFLFKCYQHFGRICKTGEIWAKKGNIPLDILEIYQQEIENILDKYNNTNTNVNLSLIKDHLIRKYQFDH